MSEPPSNPSDGTSTRGDRPSPHRLLREKLASQPPPPVSESIRPEERLRLAQQKLGLTLKGWRLGGLLGVGPISAAYDATRGVQDGASRGVVRIVIGSLAKNERARTQFIRAAYAASRFQHPRVIAVSGDGTDETGAPFVVRPWVDAEPLAMLVEREGPMSEVKALRLAEQVLDALEIAHAHGVVHGALTPSNLLVTPRGSIRLCDFAMPPGVGARAEDDVLASRRVSEWTPPERCSMSPEAATELGDLWGLGACLYFAVSKAFPRHGAETIADLARTRARPLREAALGVSDNFAALVEHALEPDPTHRYEGAYAMLGDVRRVMAGRKPKLVDAQRPNPSGSYSGTLPSRPGSHSGALPSRSWHRPISSSISLADGRARQPSSGSLSKIEVRRSEWKGNVALILAIAALVGVATFVMVRERVEEERLYPRGRPPAVQKP
jgi:serine/threonine protein kinase